MLTVKQLNKSYGSVKALDNISFTVERGEIVGFLGPNGAGKTTTLRILTGFLTPDSGRVKYNNKNLTTNYKTLIPKIGYLPENNPLYKNMRVDELLLFYAKLKGVNDKEELTETVKKCGLENVLEKEIETLSKGYKQRVGLAKALIGDPEFLLLDEPTEGLDPNQKEKIHKLIKTYAKDKAVLFSSHLLSEVRQTSNKVIIIDKGKIVASGKSEELVKKYFKNAKILLRTDAIMSNLRRALQKIETIVDMESISKVKQKFKQYQIICTKPEETSLQIFKIIVKNKWNLVEMYTKSQGLEELFRELTK